MEYRVPVDYPTGLSEIDVQFQLMKALDNLGIDFRTEVKAPSKFGYRGARFDIVVFKDKIATTIIEVKRKDHGKATVQENHYKELTGLPVVVCGGILGIPRTIEFVKQYL